jgi:hypothetical protein
MVRISTSDASISSLEMVSLRLVPRKNPSKLMPPLVSMERRMLKQLSTPTLLRQVTRTLLTLESS